MKANQFNSLLDSVKNLSSDQLRQLDEAVTATQTSQATVDAVQGGLPPQCPHCDSHDVVRNGTRDGFQRWLCRDCRHSSNAMSRTPLSHLRDKHLFTAYADCMRRGLTIRQTAQEVGLSVDRAFRWRHRFLAKSVAHQPRSVVGLLEVDEMYLRRSHKGTRSLDCPPRRRGGGSTGRRGRPADEWVPILVGRARSQPFIADHVLSRVTHNEVARSLKPIVKPGETVLCTDTHSAFINLEHTLDVAAKRFVASRHGHVRDKIYHVQSVNHYHERLGSWICRRLRGVATKYLPHYLAWMRLMSWKNVGVSAADIVESALGRQVVNL